MTSEQLQGSASEPTIRDQRAATEPLIDELMLRVQSLEEEKRRWKTAAWLLIVLLLLGFVIGAGLTVGAGSIYWSMQRRQGDQMLMMEAQRRMEAQQQQMQALEAKRRAEEALEQEQDK